MESDRSSERQHLLERLHEAVKQVNNNNSSSSNNNSSNNTMTISKAR